MTEAIGIVRNMFIVSKLIAEARQKIDSTRPGTRPDIAKVVFVEAMDWIVAQAGIVAGIMLMSDKLVFLKVKDRDAPVFSTYPEFTIIALHQRENIIMSHAVGVCRVVAEINKRFFIPIELGVSTA